MKVQNPISIRITLGEHHIYMMVCQNLPVCHPPELHLCQLAVSILVEKIPSLLHLHIPVNITASINILKLAEQMVTLHVQDEV